MKLIGAILLPPAALVVGGLSAHFMGMWGMALWLILLCACFSVFLYATWR